MYTICVAYRGLGRTCKVEDCDCGQINCLSTSLFNDGNDEDNVDVVTLVVVMVLVMSTSGGGCICERIDRNIKLFRDDEDDDS